jgi:hypothetical protein
MGVTLLWKLFKIATGQRPPSAEDVDVTDLVRGVSGTPGELRTVIIDAGWVRYIWEHEGSSRGDEALWGDLASLNKCSYERFSAALRSWVDK